MGPSKGDRERELRCIVEASGVINVCGELSKGDIGDTARGLGEA